MKPFSPGSPMLLSDTSTSRVPCTRSTTTSRSTRPRSSAVRLAGVLASVLATPAHAAPIKQVAAPPSAHLFEDGKEREDVIR